MKKEMTDFESDVNVLSVAIRDSKMFNDPYTDQTPKHVLERMYKIEAWDFTVGNTNAINFSKLFNNTMVQEILSRFSLMRYDLEVVISLQTVPQQYGVMLVGRAPAYPLNSARSSKALNWWSADPIILDIASSTFTKMLLSWPYPQPWAPINKTPSALYNATHDNVRDPLSCPWHVEIICEAFERTDSTVAASVAVDVFAGFKNVKLAGPRQKYLGEEVESQHAERELLDERRRRLNVVNCGVTSHMMQAQGYLHPHNLDRITRMATTYGSWALGSASVGSAATYAMQAATGVNKVASDVNNLEKAYNTASTALKGDKKDVQEDKKMTTKKTGHNGSSNGVKLVPIGEMCTKNLGDQFNPLSFMPETMRFANPRFAGEEDTMHSVKMIAMKPAILMIKSLALNQYIFFCIGPWRMPTFNTDSGAYPWGDSNKQAQASYANFILTKTIVHRTSWKICLTFHSSPLNTIHFKLAIQYVKSNDTPDFTSAEVDGGIYTQNIVVRGTTFECIRVPYLNVREWLPNIVTSGADYAPYSWTDISRLVLPYMKLTMTSYTKGAGSATPKCVVTMSLAADDDFRTRGLKSNRPDQIPEPPDMETPLQAPSPVVLKQIRRSAYGKGVVSQMNEPQYVKLEGNVPVFYTQGQLEKELEELGIKLDELDNSPYFRILAKIPIDQSKHKLFNQTNNGFMTSHMNINEVFGTSEFEYIYEKGGDNYEPEVEVDEILLYEDMLRRFEILESDVSCPSTFEIIPEVDFTSSWEAKTIDWLTFLFRYIRPDYLMKINLKPSTNMSPNMFAIISNMPFLAPNLVSALPYYETGESMGVVAARPETWPTVDVRTTFMHTSTFCSSYGESDFTTMTGVGADFMNFTNSGIVVDDNIEELYTADVRIAAGPNFQYCMLGPLPAITVFKRTQ